MDASALAVIADVPWWVQRVGQRGKSVSVRVE